MKYYIEGLKKYANFSAKATSEEFVGFFVVYMLTYFLFIAYDIHYFGIDLANIRDVFSTDQLYSHDIYAFFIIIPYLACTVRRLNDLNLSKWLCLSQAIPVIDILFVIFVLSKKTSPVPENR